MNIDKIRNFRKKLRELEMKVFWQLKQDSSCFGITLSQCHTLMEIGKEREISIVELASELGIDPSTLSRTIEGMVNIGLVNRTLNPSDRRYVSIALTKTGNALYDSIENHYNNYISKLFKNIPKEKHNQVLESFILFSDAMNKFKEDNKSCKNENSK